MTKRLTITLVALALFALMAVMPVSGMAANPVTGLYNGSVINPGPSVPTVFIGEQGLNLTHVLSFLGGGPIDGPPTFTKLGWWAPGAISFPNNPSKVLDITASYKTFQVTSDLAGYTGNWYILNNANQAANPIPALIIADPSLDLNIWDISQNVDQTGKSVPQGTPLTFKINTNMASFGTDSNTLGTLTDPTGLNMPLRGDVIDITNWLTVDDGVVSPAGNVFTATATPGAPELWIWSTGRFINGTVPTAPGLPFTYRNTSAISRIYTTYGWTPWTFTETDYLCDPTGLTMIVTPLAPVLPVIVNASEVSKATDGYITVKVKPEDGTTYTSLIADDTVTPATTMKLNSLWINQQPQYTGNYNGVPGATIFWKTSALNFAGMPAYPAGTYTVTAESELSKMKDNYKNAGADYTGKTVSAAYTVALVSDTVKITANKDSVVRSKPFSVTVTGRPGVNYYVWVKGTSAMSGLFDDQPPMINIGQAGVAMDTPLGVATVRFHGNYKYQNGGGRSIYQDVAPQLNDGVRYYANITTSTAGVRTIEFITTNWTKAQKYTIRVEQNFGGQFKSDEVDVKVEKGAVTIVAAGDQSYYLGEEVKFSGTNTESQTTFLFITGPNLPSNGAQINSGDPRNNGVTDGVAATFQQAAVQGDNTWEFKWGTSNMALDAGTYTVYAVAQPRDRDANHLINTAYGTVSIIVKKPFVSATASQSTVAKGDRLYITGTAEGNPSAVAVWVLGKNYAVRDSASVNTDASFSYEVKQDVTKNMYSGQYFVVVQHPMQNNQFDINLNKDLTDPVNGGFVYNAMLQQQGVTTGTKIFKLLGVGSLQGSDAAEALVQGINDANVDDTYTKLQFLVEEPVIRIDPVGDKHVGDKFTITAMTNLAVDDEVLFEVYSSSFKPTLKSQSGEFSGATGTVKVTKGDGGYNKLTFDVDASTFKPDEYLIKATAVIQDATGTALFNVLEGAAPTAVPTTVAPTGAVTTVVTTVPTATPTKTPTQPGFGALVALIGLGAVAFLVVRRH